MREYVRLSSSLTMLMLPRKTSPKTSISRYVTHIESLHFIQSAYRIKKYLGDKPRPGGRWSPASSSSTTTPRAGSSVTSTPRRAALSTTSNGVTLDQRVAAIEEERRMLDSMLSVAHSEKEALRQKSEILSSAERSMTTVRETIVEGVESRKHIAS